MFPCYVDLDVMTISLICARVFYNTLNGRKIKPFLHRHKCYKYDPVRFIIPFASYSSTMSWNLTTLQRLPIPI